MFIFHGKLADVNEFIPIIYKKQKNIFMIILLINIMPTVVTM